MDNDTLKSLEPVFREKVMRGELGEEKCKVIDKYNLHPNHRLLLGKDTGKISNPGNISVISLQKKSSVLGMVFHINRLCFAKTKYFENNWEEFEACVYDYRKGFVETEIYNMEYIRQKSTGIVLDLRELSKIKWLSEFKELCAYLEEEHRKTSFKNNIVNY